MRIPSILKNIFESLPRDQFLRDLMSKLPVVRQEVSDNSKLVLVQAVHDPYYIAIFSTLLSQMSKQGALNVELFVFTSVGSEFGIGVKSTIKRSFPYIWLSTKPWIRMHEGITKKIGYRSVSWAHPVSDFLSYFRANLIWKKLSSVSKLESLVIDDIKCGDLIIDTYLRFRPAKTVELADPFLRYLIWQACRDVARSKHYFSSRRPKFFFSSYATYIQHGIAVRVALIFGTRVITFGNLQQIGKELNKNDVFHTKNPTRYLLDFSKRADQANLLDVARVQLEGRLSGQIDVATSYMTSSAYTAKETQCPNVRGAVIVYLHDFFDSPHIYADLVFPDFWSWICFTIETLQTAKIPFYLKRHPNQVHLSAETVFDLQNRYPSVLFVPDGVTTTQLVSAGMSCAVTVYGTIAHEVAYLGVPSIACARHPHINFNFCQTAQSILEYSSLLKQSNQLRFKDHKEIKNQVLIFYAMHNIDLLTENSHIISAFASLRKICNYSNLNTKEIISTIDALSNDFQFTKYVKTLVANNLSTNHES